MRLIVDGCFLGFADMPAADVALYDLTTIDGDLVRLCLGDFFLDNDLGEDAPAVEALAVGETYRGGGGAAPEWSITRVS